ncbi:MAG: hypothetical protein P1V20_13230 [Verrucomicrobiales bacterium]|nr:hypothetical protein [Verrucomicrobiales bacterium]
MDRVHSANLWVAVCVFFTGSGYTLGQKNEQKASPDVRRIVGQNAAAPSVQRLALAENLTLLSPSDTLLIFEYLKATSAKSSGIVSDLQTEYKIKNALLNCLRRSSVPAQKQFLCYIEILENPKIDIAIRDYVVQHMTGLLLREDCSTTLRNDLTNYLFNNSGKHPATTLPGTILLSLNQVYQQQLRQPDFFYGKLVQGNRLLDTCKTVAGTGDINPQNIASAIAVAGEVYPTETPDKFPEWITETFQQCTTGESIKPNSEKAFVALAGARALLDSKDSSLRGMVHSTAKKLGTSSLTGRLLNGALPRRQTKQSVPAPKQLP